MYRRCYLLWSSVIADFDIRVTIASGVRPGRSFDVTARVDFECPVRRSVLTLTHERTHEQARQKGSVEVRLRCDSMDLAGEVVQDLGRFLKVI